MRRVTLVILGLVGSFPLRLATQATGSLGLGQRVRLRTESSSSWVTGTILALDADSVRLLLSDTTGQLSIRRGAITRLEVSRGMKSSAGSGARTGLLIGAAFGALVFVGSGDDQSGWFSPTAGEKALLVGVTGGVGALVGSIAGSSVHERWRRVSLAEARVALLPRGAALMLSFRL